MIIFAPIRTAIAVTNGIHPLHPNTNLTKNNRFTPLVWSNFGIAYDMLEDNMRNHKITLATIALVLIAGAFIANYSSQTDWDYELIREGISNFGIWAPAVFIALYTIIAVFLPVSPFIVMAGLLFGSFWGAFYALLGGVLGATVSFVVGRILGKPFVDQVLQREKLELLSRYNRHLENNGLYAVLALRLIPLIPLNGLSLALGITRVSLVDYALGTFLGIVPSTIILSYFGSGIYTWSWEKIILVATAVILLLIAPAIWHKRRQANQPNNNIDSSQSTLMDKKFN